MLSLGNLPPQQRDRVGNIPIRFSDNTGSEAADAENFHRGDSEWRVFVVTAF
ncbi:hypothetical protein OG594_45915 [Streptomyces sp. NBC_01214]|uniref:hypothetical protein n=1 Tax=Streptomyces sp. NBC_01214 TaxID=2903777 RepID=UPI002251FBDD|nr:hypothetical protein [Streptomyces sp. NBC_01214]MCX4808804.1 hypothetical protein [Streptomyces sp. NBC_01214]